MINKRIIGFLSISFGISILVGLLFHLAKIPFGSLGGIALLAGVLMPAPLVAALLVEGKFKKYRVFIPLKTHKREMLVFFLLPGLVAIVLLVLVLGATLLSGNLLKLPGFGSLALGIDDLKANIAAIYGADLAASANYPPSIGLFIGVTALAALVAGWSINGLFAFGEEYGWRGFLWEELSGLGFVPKNLVIGFVWGLWHAPLIVLGYNYPGNPLLGVVFMVLFTTGLSFILSAIRRITGSVLPVAAMHGAINGLATMAMLLTLHNNQYLNGFLGIGACVLMTVIGFGLEKWVGNKTTDQR